MTDRAISATGFLCAAALAGACAIADDEAIVTASDQALLVDEEYNVRESVEGNPQLTKIGVYVRAPDGGDGAWRATFTQGAYTFTSSGPTRGFCDDSAGGPLIGCGNPVVEHGVWARLLAAPFDRNTWLGSLTTLRDFVRLTRAANLRGDDDLLALAYQYEREGQNRDRRVVDAPVAGAVPGNDLADPREHHLEPAAPAGHEVAWLALSRGHLIVSGAKVGLEMVVFEEGNQPIEVVTDGDGDSVIASAVKHPTRSSPARTPSTPAARTS